MTNEQRKNLGSVLMATSHNYCANDGVSIYVGYENECLITFKDIEDVELMINDETGVIEHYPYTERRILINHNLVKRCDKYFVRAAIGLVDSLTKQLVDLYETNRSLFPKNDDAKTKGSSILKQLKLEAKDELKAT